MPYCDQIIFDMFAQYQNRIYIFFKFVTFSLRYLSILELVFVIETGYVYNLFI